MSVAAVRERVGSGGAGLLEETAEGGEAQLGQLGRLDLPQGGVEELQRDPAVVAGGVELAEEGGEAEVALPGQDAVGVGGQLAGDAGDVGDLHEGEVGRGEQAEVLEL